MTKLFAIVSEQGTACHEACLCERCHANPEHRAAVERNGLTEIVKTVPMGTHRQALQLQQTDA